MRGVPVRVDLSWLLIAGLVVWYFARQLSEVLAGRGTGVLVAAASVAALLFFASLLAHELGHALASLDRGIPVLGISLFLLGGMTESASEAKRPRDEFVIVGIGPFISLVLAAAFGLLHAALAAHQPYAAIIGSLAWWNLLLAIFNVLPGYPLDGGRLLRSILWGITGRRHGSTRWAARVGQGFALALILGGIYSFTDLPLPPPGPFRLVAVFFAANGWWGILIGYFLLRGASDAYDRASVSERLARRTVREVMGSAPPALDPDTPVADAIARLQERPSLLWPVGIPLRGAVRLEDLDAVARADWPFTRVADIALGTEYWTIDVGTSMDRALTRLSQAPGNMLLVVDGGSPVGLLTPSLVAGIAS